MRRSTDTSMVPSKCLKASQFSLSSTLMPTNTRMSLPHSAKTLWLLQFIASLTFSWLLVNQTLHRLIFSSSLPENTKVAISRFIQELQFAFLFEGIFVKGGNKQHTPTFSNTCLKQWFAVWEPLQTISLANLPQCHNLQYFHVFQSPQLDYLMEEWPKIAEFWTRV